MEFTMKSIYNKVFIIICKFVSFVQQYILYPSKISIHSSPPWEQLLSVH